MAEVVRKLGMIEKACSIRHDLGHYPCASITARLSFDQAQDNAKTRWAIKRALSEVVLAKPIMCCGIIGEEGNDPAYVRLPKIEVSSCVEFHIQDQALFENVARSSPALARVLETQHETLFSDLHKRPGWRVLVMLPEDKTISQIDVLFAWHHGFFDGLSGVNFHKALVRGMNRALDHVDMNENFAINVPQPLHINQPIEKLMKFPVSWKYLFDQCWNYYVPKWISDFIPSACTTTPTPVWAGNKTQLSKKSDYRMRMRVIPISAEELTLLLGKARQNKMSLTCLFHGALATAIAIRAPEAQSFLTLTPLSLRNFTGSDKYEAMGNEFDDLWCTYDQAIVSAARRLQDRGSKDLGPMWDAGRMFKSTMAEHRKQIPWDLELAFPGWFDVRALHLEQVGKDRQITFEMSNIGSIERNPTGGDANLPRHCRIERFVWAQSAMVTGPLFTVGSASVDDGPLTFTFAWQKGATDDSLADSVVGTFQDLLKRVIEL